MNRIIVLLIVSLFFISCGSSSDSPGNSATTDYLSQLGTCDSNANDPLIGCWYSEACVQNAIQTNYYHQGVLNFHNNGNINYGMNFYTNATCTGTPAVIDATPPDTYTFVANELSAETQSVNQVLSTVLKVNSSGIDSYTAYHITADNRLCFVVGDYLINENGGTLIIGLHPRPTNYTINTDPQACLTH